MMRWVAALASGTLVALVGTLATAAAPATRPADGPRTYHDVYREVLGFNRKTMIEAYRTIGGHDPRWDAPAMEALELTARRFSFAVVPNTTYAIEPLGNADAPGQLAKQALDKGCEDPLVTYVYATSLLSAGQVEEARPILTKAVAGLEKSKYSRYRLFCALYRLDSISTDAQVRHTLATKLEQAQKEVLAGPFPDDGARIAIEAYFQELLSELQLVSRNEIVGAFEASPGADPWIVGCLRANVETDLAWEARGSGWANTVTPQGWQGFKTHLALARKAAEAAHAARPQLPQPAAQMITVAMGQSDPAEVKSWFKKAIAAQVDYVPAYDAVYGALLPRWGGSFEEILEVGLEAARTKRYDTTAPWQFIRAITEVAQDDHGGGSRDIWTVPQLRKAASEVFEGYAAYEKGKPGGSIYFGYQGALEFVNKNNRGAKVFFDRVQGPVPPECFTLFGLPASSSLETIYLQTHPDQETINGIYRAETKGSPEEVSQLLAKAMAKIDPKERIYEILSVRKAVEDMRMAYASGAWVSLIDDARLPAWQVESTVVAKDKMLFVGGGTTRFQWLSRLRLPDRHYEVLLKFKITEQMPDHRGWFGLEVGRDEEGFGVFVSGLDPDQVAIHVPGSTTATIVTVPAVRANAIEIRAVYFDGVPEVTVNGSKMQFVLNPQVNLATLPATNRLLIGSADADWPCPRVRVTELKIRKLADRPK